MFISMLKALLVGVILAVPVGPVLFFVIQKTMCDSRRAGLYSGVGSALADTLYSAVGVYALGLIRDFVDRNVAYIMLVGGILIVLIGINMFRAKIRMPEDEPEEPKNGLWYTGQTFLCALSNPTALAVAMGVLAAFHLDSASLAFPAWIILPFVFVGEVSYWTFVTFALDRFLHLTPRVLLIVSRVAGCIVMALGVFLFIKGLIMLV